MNRIALLLTLMIVPGCTLRTTMHPTALPMLDGYDARARVQRSERPDALPIHRGDDVELHLRDGRDVLVPRGPVSVQAGMLSVQSPTNEALQVDVREVESFTIVHPRKAATIGLIVGVSAVVLTITSMAILGAASSGSSGGGSGVPLVGGLTNTTL